MIGADERLHLAARIPVNREFQYLPLTSRYHQRPKWYQYKPRALLGRHWLKGLLPESDSTRRSALIVADEGGVGKTKAAAYVVNKMMSNSPKPVLVVCPRRLIRPWGEELRSLMPHRWNKIKAKPEGSARWVLDRPSPGCVYVVSKHSLAGALGDLTEREGGWSDRGTRFSLLIIDEAHQGKADGSMTASDYDTEEEDDGASKVEATRLWRTMKRISHEFSDTCLALTASPLSLKIPELVHLAEMIGVDGHFLTPLRRVGSSSDEVNDFLDRWEESLEPVRSLMHFRGTPEEGDIESFIDQMLSTDPTNRLAILPHESEVRSALSEPTHPGWKQQDLRWEWLSELNPLSPFLSITLRRHLGEEADEIFRRRVTWTEHVRLHEAHVSELEDERKVGGLQRMEQSWPTNRYGDGSVVKVIREPDFDVPEGATNGVGLQCPEPRVAAVLEVLRRDPVLNDPDNTTSRRGAVIFCNFLRTVKQVGKWLDGKKIEISDGKHVTIVVHRITGAEDDAEDALRRIDDHQSDKRGYFHVVVGTSAIQEGLSINWATTVVHWDLVSNPQMLEQRTWRLDRHKTDRHHDEFHVVYLVTQTETDDRMVEMITSRARLASTLLGGSFCVEDWPLPFQGQEGLSQPHTREYSGKPIKFLREEDLEIDSLYDSTTDDSGTPGRRIRLGQQQAIIAGLGRGLSWGLDEEAMREGRGITAVNLAKEGDQSRDLRRVMAMAENSDLRALGLLHPTPPKARQNELRIDGQPLPEGPLTRKKRAVISIDPEGGLMSRIVRRLPETGGFVLGPSDRKRTAVFSIDCSEPLAEHSRELSQMPDHVSGGIYGRLFVCRLDPGDVNVTWSMSSPNESPELAERMLLALEEAGSVSDPDAADSIEDGRGRPMREFLAHAVEYVLEDLCNSLDRRMGESEDVQIVKQLELDGMRREGADSQDDLDRMRYLQRDISDLESEAREMEDWYNHLAQCGDGFYGPVLRYYEGAR